MKSNQRWVFAFWAYFGILMFILISAYLRIIPTEISQFPYYDKILHFLLLGIAAYLGHLAFNKHQIKIFNISLPLTPVIMTFFCIVDEAIQLFVPYRSFDLVDLAAGVCGIALFTWLAERQNLNKSKNNQL
jgi:polysaccharide biosynthesis protein VpsQ